MESISIKILLGHVAVVMLPNRVIEVCYSKCDCSTIELFVSSVTLKRDIQVQTNQAISEGSPAYQFGGFNLYPSHAL